MLNKTRGTDSRASKQYYFTEKVGFLRGFLRYLGFQKVKTIHARPFFSGQHNRHRHSDRSLRNRKVEVNGKKTPAGSDNAQIESDYETGSEHHDEMVYEQGMFDDTFRKFQGFRATSKNIKKLADELTGSLSGSFESEEEHKFRVELSLALCGLGKIQAGPDALLSGIARRSISTTKLTRLDRYLHMPLSKLVRSACSSGMMNNKNLNARHIPTLAVLTEQEALEPLNTGHDIVARMNMCQGYFLHGEGRQILQTCGFSDVNRLEQLLPPAPQSINSSAILESVQGLFLAITDQREVSYKSLNIPGIRFVPGVAEKSYNPANPEHRALVILQALQNLYDGLYSGYGMEASLQSRDPGTTLDDEKTRLQQILTGAAHAVMKKAFPEECNESRYQQVHLKTDSNQLRWNSDSVQPRAGWREGQAFEPVKSPERNLQKRSLI